MRTVSKHIINYFLLFVALCAIFSVQGCQQHGMLNPKGIITFEERKLFFDTFALMLIVVLPVIVMSFTFIYHYQVSHRVRDYKPHWAHNIFLESLWWGIPCAIIVVLAILTWKKTFELDPYRVIPGYDQTLQIQVIALPYKWLFIYPDYHIATVNYLVIPVGEQVEYVMTGDNSAMTAFFIPQIGSQIYVMAGMRSRLHLVANHPGTYEGLNTQYNGGGFSDMHFTVNAIPPEEMQEWINTTAKSANHLTMANYLQLVNPSLVEKPLFFSNVENGLFDYVVDTYMHAFGPTHPRGETVQTSGGPAQLHDTVQTISGAMHSYNSGQTSDGQTHPHGTVQTSGGLVHTHGTADPIRSGETIQTPEKKA